MLTSPINLAHAAAAGKNADNNSNYSNQNNKLLKQQMDNSNTTDNNESSGNLDHSGLSSGQNVNKNLVGRHKAHDSITSVDENIVEEPENYNNLEKITNLSELKEQSKRSENKNGRHKARDSQHSGPLSNTNSMPGEVESNSVSACISPVITSSNNLMSSSNNKGQSPQTDDMNLINKFVDQFNHQKNKKRVRNSKEYNN